MAWCWLLCGGLAVAVIALLLKLFWMQKSMNEICACMQEHLSSDTNMQILISSRDRYVRHLAADLNRQLALLRRQRLQFAEGDTRLTEAIVNISHDLRTPLTAIFGYLELLEQNADRQSVQTRFYLAQIADRMEVLRQLTEELFRYSLLTVEEELHPERVDLRALLQDCLLAQYAAFQAAGITPELELTGQPVWRNLDRSAFQRVVGNLVSNALKYSDGDFRVVLNDAGELICSNQARQLSQAQVARLFDRFYTVQTARGSTGLGLSIAKELTERMQGSIHAGYADGRLFIRITF